MGEKTRPPEKNGISPVPEWMKKDPAFIEKQQLEQDRARNLQALEVERSKISPEQGKEAADKAVNFETSVLRLERRTAGNEKLDGALHEFLSSLETNSMFGVGEKPLTADHAKRLTEFFLEKAHELRDVPEGQWSPKKKKK